MRTILIFLFVTGVSLYVYNPELDDFKNYIAELNFRLEQERQQTNPLGRALSQQKPEPIPTIVGSTITRNNFFFLSTYELDVGTSVTGPIVWRYMGVLGMFFETEQPVIRPSALDG